MSVILSKQRSKWRKPIVLMAVIVMVILIGDVSCAASNGYNPVLTNDQHHYDAQVVNQVGKGGYAIYTDGPYDTSRRTKTRDADGSDYTNAYVRVLQTKTTKTGSYVKLRCFNKTLGWMNTHGIKKVSFATVASGVMKQANFSGSAALISAGKTKPTVVNAGMADTTTHTANSSSGTVLYPLASLQKAMTGAIIQQLISQHKLAPSTPLSRYYPQVSGSQQITVKQLLSMTSGITNPEQLPTSAPTESEAVALAIKTLKVSSDKTFNYSDDDYVLLAGIISKVTGKSYAANVQSRLLSKLGLTHTVLVNQSIPALKRTTAYSYTLTAANAYAQPQTVGNARMAAIVGAGNVLTTPTDFTAIIQGLQNGKVLSKPQYQRLLHYGSTYSGGFYVSRSGVKFNNGSFSGLNYHTGYYATTGNYHAAIVFGNRGPLKNNAAQKDFVYQLYRVAVYY